MITEKSQAPRQSLVLDILHMALTVWKMQFAVNVFFGFPLIIAAASYVAIGHNVIAQLLLIYVAIYLLVYVPFYGTVPYLMLTYPRKVLLALRRGQNPTKEAILEAVQKLLRYPFGQALMTFFVAFGGFSAGAQLLRLGLVPEVMPNLTVVLLAAEVIGLVVAISHTFLTYFAMEAGVRQDIEELAGALGQGLAQKIQIQKISLFTKIFWMALFATVAGQLSLGVVLLTEIAITQPEKLGRAMVHSAPLTLFTMLYVLTVTTIAARIVTDPLNRIIAWSKDIIAGRQPRPVNLVTNDEIQEVLTYSHQMVAQLQEGQQVLEIKVKARTREIRELAEQLEQKVRERTQQLQDRVNELERFHKLTVGRELRMIELKKELKKLGERIDKSSVLANDANSETKP